MKMYIQMAEHILKIAEYVKKDEMDFKDIPFMDILRLVQEFYEKKAKEGNCFAELYGLLLLKGLEHRDKEEIFAALSMLAQHLSVFACDELEKDALKIRNYCLQSNKAHLINNEKIRKWHETHRGDLKHCFEGKGVIYSAIIGGYDQIKEPKYVSPELQYILFTDNPELKSDKWKVQLIENKDKLDNVRLARRIKILGHEYLKDFDYSIWVDGKLEIIGDLREYIEQYRKKEPILCFNHYINDCIYDEKTACIALNKDTPEVIEKQILKYKNEGYPEHNGLVETGIMVRELKDERVQKTMELWWKEIIDGSRRDQLSFNYVCWKNNLVYDTTDLFIYGNKYVKLYSHN